MTYWIVPPLAAGDDAPIPIGQPYANVEVRIVGDDDEPVAEGEPGELLVRTPTMMRGYWGRPDLDARAFWTRQVHGHFEDVYLRTGDLVRRRDDGLLEFHGRKDRQVKARGYRVELDEVEVALGSHDAVESAAAYGVPDEDGSLHIEATVTVRAGQRGHVRRAARARRDVAAALCDSRALRHHRRDATNVDWEDRSPRACPTRAGARRNRGAGVRERLARYIATDAAQSAGLVIGEDEDLLASGLLDSLSVMSLIHFIEQDLGIDVPAEDVTIENFVSLRAIDAYLRERGV